MLDHLRAWIGRSSAPVLDSTSTPKDEAASASHWIDLGNDELDRGRLAEAAAYYQRGCSADAESGNAHVNLGFALGEMRRYAEALDVLGRAVLLLPGSADAHFLLGTTRLACGDPTGAVSELKQAIALRPNLLPAHRDLGRALFEAGNAGAAEVALKAGLAVDDTDVDLNLFLGNVYAESQRWDDAAAHYRAVLARQPRHAVALSNLAPALLHAADFAAAATSARAALAIDPGLINARSNLLMALSRDPACSAQAYLQEAREFGRQVSPNAAEPRRAAHAARPAGPLRIGLVSADLCRHPVGYFLESVFARWDHKAASIHVYDNRPRDDEVASRLRRHADAWSDISRQSDEQACDRIQHDGIDLLVDLSGHTSGNRLPLFARRPAPVQVAWLGYWASTGVPAIDYLLADPVSVPPEHESHFSEHIWRLPVTRLCFTPPDGAGDVASPPASANGVLTFGSFQNPAKLNPPVLALWARVLDAVPGSRLRLQALQLAGAEDRAHMVGRLRAAGIDPARADLHGPASRPDYLAAHAAVDIILDTFPHSGGTTTCEALWMGVPTLTLKGQSLLGRQGASLLAAAGLDDWIVDDADTFVARACEKAADPDALAQLRRQMRPQIVASPLLDAGRFAADLQNAFAEMCALDHQSPSATSLSSVGGAPIKETSCS
jgi:protein O-GlcNAc transferase